MPLQHQVQASENNLYNRIRSLLIDDFLELGNVLWINVPIASAILAFAEYRVLSISNHTTSRSSAWSMRKSLRNLEDFFPLPSGEASDMLLARARLNRSGAGWSRVFKMKLWLRCQCGFDEPRYVNSHAIDSSECQRRPRHAQAYV